MPKCLAVSDNCRTFAAAKVGARLLSALGVLVSVLTSTMRLGNSSKLDCSRL